MLALPSPRRARLAAVLVLAAFVCPVALPQSSAVRGVWIPNTDTRFFDSRAEVAAGCKALAEAGVNVVFPVVWSKGHTLFRSQVAAELTGAEVDPRYGERDPLAEVLFEAHRHGMEVVPWFEYGFAAGHERFHGKVLDARPEWAALDARGKPLVKNGFEWMNSLDPEVQAFMTAMVLELCERYDVDGVQGDDRLPALPAEAGHNPGVVAAWRAETGSDPPADKNDPEWTRWRAERLTDYLAELRAAVRAVSPDLAFTMAPGAPRWALRDYLQDQRAWVERGLVDSLHPQAYARELGAYERMVDEILAIDWIGRKRALVAPGILASFGDFLASPELALGAVEHNRERDLPGEVWFFHEALLRADGAVGRALAEGPYRKPARLPWRERDGWRPPAVVAERERGAWSARVKAAGTYGVYARLAEGAAGERLSVRAPRAEGSLVLAEDVVPGWYRIGTVELRPGARVEVEGDGEPSSVLEALVMIDRKAER